MADVGTDVVEPDGLVHPRPLERRLAFQLHTEFGEERFGSLEVLDNDENVVHPLKRHLEADGGTRTPDPFITSEVLYQLSYVGARAESR